MNRNWWGMNKSQRMQLKAFICLLGFLLIIGLTIGRILFSLIGKYSDQEQDPEQTAQPHVPVVQVLYNVWIVEEDEEGIVVFCDGLQERYSFALAEDALDAEDPDGQKLYYQPESALREQVVDVQLTDGVVTSVNVKSEKINGRILSAGEDYVEVEGYGRLLLSTNYRGYRLYGSLEMCTVRDIPFGYNFTDLCLENGEICAILIAKEEAMENIRVLIKTADYGGRFHQNLTLTADTDFSIVYGEYGSQNTERHSAGEEITFTMDDVYFQGERVWVVPDVLTGKITLKNVSRSQGIPSYRGQMELLNAEEGIVVINELPLEEYLYSVVPSEMPSGYPPEALKAQAICARTYAYGHMKQAGYPQYGAHVDDSSSYQVYNNILEQKSTTTAVKDTYGQLLFTANDELAETYYYSTSCGVGSDASVWKTLIPPDLPYLKAKSLSRTALAETVSALAEGVELPENDIGVRFQKESAFADFITSVNADDFESQEGWYRWQYSVEKLDSSHMAQVLQKRYAANSRLVLTWKDGEYVSQEIEEIGDIKDIYVEKRGSGGVAEELIIEAEKGKYKVISEHNIRYVLNDGSSKILRQDGSRVSSPSLLPSGFFVISTGKESGNVVAYTLSGGGFGHGVGMSQNGAKQMAASGFQCGEILSFFFEYCELKSIYDQEE